MTWIYVTSVLVIAGGTRMTKKRATPPTISTVLSRYGIDVHVDREIQTILCPVHDENVPSCRLFADEEKEYLYCHACGFQGDAFDLIKAKEGIDEFPAVVKFAEEHFGVGDEPLRKGPGRRGGISGRERNIVGTGHFVPAGVRRRTRSWS